MVDWLIFCITLLVDYWGSFYCEKEQLEDICAKVRCHELHPIIVCIHQCLNDFVVNHNILCAWDHHGKVGVAKTKDDSFFIPLKKTVVTFMNKNLLELAQIAL